MILKLYRLIYALTLILIFSIFLFHFGFVVFPLLCVLSGMLLRTIFKKNHLLVFSFLIPILPGLAGFHGSGFPKNYFILPLLALAGMVLADSILHKEFLPAGKEAIPRHYVYFLFILSISFVFVAVRWSNILLSKMAVLKNTPVDISGERLSFAIIFPILELGVFVLSVPFFSFCQTSSNTNRLAVSFLGGQGISVLFALGQLALSKPGSGLMVSGLASDPTAFGMLCAISFIVAWYLIKRASSSIVVILLVVFLVGIAISSTRVAFMALLVIPLIGFPRIKKSAAWISGIVAFMVVASVFIGIVKTRPMKNVNEIKQTMVMIKKLVKGSQGRQVAFHSIAAKRDILWNYAWNAIKQFPLSGIGTGNFLFWGRSHYGKNYFHHLTANQYLFVAVSNGIIGLVLFVLFILSILNKKQWPERFVILLILVMFVFNDYLWFSEVFLGFWLICSLGETKKTRAAWNKEKWFILSLVSLFVVTNILGNSLLMPHQWIKASGGEYDYGFWDSEEDGEGRQFNWSKGESGLYVYLDKQGRSTELKINCRAPLPRLADGKQEVDIYWRGKYLKRVVFRDIGQYPLRIEDHEHNEGFLEFRVRPTFNLQQMGLGEETRDLGFQLSR